MTGADIADIVSVINSTGSSGQRDLKFLTLDTPEFSL